MFRLLKPKYFIPVHGETRHLYRNAQLAEEMGIDPSHIFMMDNGNVLELGKRSAKLNGTVPSGAILIDGLGVGDIARPFCANVGCCLRTDCFPLSFPCKNPPESCSAFRKSSHAGLFTSKIPMSSLPKQRSSRSTLHQSLPKSNPARAIGRDSRHP